MKSEFNKPKIILDTKPLIKLFAQEEGWRFVQEILLRIEAGEIKASISVVTLTEIYYKYMQEGRVDLAKARIESLRYAVYIEKAQINEETAVKAGEFKAKYDISIADAFIAATAYLKSSIVISDDPDFKKIKEIEALSEEEFAKKL